MGFVVETFLRSVRPVCTHVEGLENPAVVRLLTNLVANGWTATVCESEGLLIGWAVHGERNRLAWFYVREMFRLQGVGRYMLKHAGIDSARPVTTPFLPNRDMGRFRGLFRITHRPYLCLPR